jgi:ubiquinone/menaquinone biosynthesis C-methylase UbiE
MARLNRDMEMAAITALQPDPTDAVLAVGFGPGVGVAALAARLQAGTVAGIDPSASMLALARRRARASVARGQVHLVRAGANDIPWADGAFQGVVAVNSVQLWEPLGASVHEVARVLTPGGRIVTVTHTWAIEKHASVADWAATLSTLFAMSGLVEVRHHGARFRSGPGLVLQATKPRDSNPMAP